MSCNHAQSYAKCDAAVVGSGGYVHDVGHAPETSLSSNCASDCAQEVRFPGNRPAAASKII